MQTQTLRLALGESFHLADIGSITLFATRGRATFLLEKDKDDTICLDEGEEIALKVLRKTPLGVEIEVRAPDCCQIYT